MGIYQDAINLALTTGSKPNIAADDADGREKRGLGMSLEQPLADGGETGLFLRAGWNDGQTESFEFTESDRNLGFGGQLDGVHWGREDDRAALGVVINGISTVHQRYLALGGCGFELCDGALDYGHETFMETHYRMQAGQYAQISPDFQFIENPGYNRARGPARVYSLRLHLQY
jgi:carbohydrate-selective porin OprB